MLDTIIPCFPGNILIITFTYYNLPYKQDNNSEISENNTIFYQSFKIYARTIDNQYVIVYFPARSTA